MKQRDSGKVSSFGMEVPGEQACNLAHCHKLLALTGYADGNSPTDSFAAVTSRFAVASEVPGPSARPKGSTRAEL